MLHLVLEVFLAYIKVPVHEGESQSIGVEVPSNNSFVQEVEYRSKKVFEITIWDKIVFRAQ